MDILFFNPHAGTIKKHGITAEQLLAKLEAKGIYAVISEYMTDDEMINVAAKASGRVIVAGGDGTIHSILKAVDRCHAMTLAIIPAGTANHLASALGIPNDLDAAIDVIAKGRTKSIDLGKVDGTVFSQAAGAGIHAKVFHLYGEHKEKSAVDAATAVGKALAGWEPQPMRVVIDGEPYVEELTQITAANTPKYGRVTIAPDAKTDDGLLDVIMVGKLSKLEIIEYGIAAITGKLLDMPKTNTVRAKKIQIEAIGTEQIDVHADAEPVGFTPVMIEILPGCLNVVVPEGQG